MLAFLASAATGKAQTPPTGVTTRLTLQLVDPTGRNLESGTLWLEAKGNRWDRRKVEFAGVPVTLTLPANTDWFALLDTAGYWLPEARIRTAGAGMARKIPLAVWPTTHVTGRLNLDGESDVRPTDLAAVFESPRTGGFRPDIVRSRARCSLDEDLGFDCVLPATWIDLTLRAEGFAPAHWWAIQLSEGKRKALAEVKMVSGGALSGTVLVEEESRLLGEVSITIAPESASGTQHLREGGPPRRLRCDERGFFQFEGLEEGIYSVEAELDGFGVATVSSIRVSAGEPTSLTKPIRLRRPMRFGLSINPPEDFLGRPWRVELSRQADLSAKLEEVFSGETQAGRVALASVVPGVLSLALYDSLGNTVFSEWWEAEGPVLDRTIELGQVAVRGSLSHGGEAIAGRISFSGQGSRYVTMEASSDGDFAGFLPREGWWKVAVETADSGVGGSNAVEVKSNADGIAEVEIELPDTEVFGRVLSAGSRRPVSGAQVVLENAGERMRTTSGKDGGFEFRGAGALAETLFLSASARQHGERLDSAVLPVEAYEGSSTGPLELLLAEPGRVMGRVLTARGRPVHGATVTLLPYLAGSRGLPDRVKTDPEGRFVGRVPLRARSVVAIVGASGAALRPFMLELSQPDHVLVVEQDGGNLRIAVEGNDGNPQGTEYTVLREGIAMPVLALFEWARRHGELFFIAERHGYIEFRAPRMSSGQYQVCVKSLTLLETCESGYLSPGGTLDLTLSVGRVQ